MFRTHKTGRSLLLATTIAATTATSTTAAATAVATRFMRL